MVLLLALIHSSHSPRPSTAMVSVSGQHQLGSWFPSSSVREQSRSHLQIIVCHHSNLSEGSQRPGSRNSCLFVQLRHIGKWPGTAYKLQGHSEPTDTRLRRFCTDIKQTIPSPRDKLRVRLGETRTFESSLSTGELGKPCAGQARLTQTRLQASTPGWPQAKKA